jgi:hypothetical protein
MWLLKRRNGPKPLEKLKPVRFNMLFLLVCQAGVSLINMSCTNGGQALLYFFTVDHVVRSSCADIKANMDIMSNVVDDNARAAIFACVRPSVEWVYNILIQTPQCVEKQMMNQFMRFMMQTIQSSCQKNSNRLHVRNKDRSHNEPFNLISTQNIGFLLYFCWLCRGYFTHSFW